MNNSKEKRLIYAEYGEIEKDLPIEVAYNQIQKALEAQKSGSWENLKLTVENEYDSYYIYIVGQRPETDNEVSLRLGRDEVSKSIRRDQYERLKKEFE